MTNRTKTVLLALGIGGTASALPAQGQSVIAAAGGVAKGEHTILEWTLGEPIVETGTRSTAIYTQGFHQPLLRIQKWTAHTGAKLFQTSMQVYPNPTAAVVYVKLAAVSETPLALSLSDVNGKLLQTVALPARTTVQSLNLAGYAKGVYLLRITGTAGAVHGEYKILKAH